MKISPHKAQIHRATYGLQHYQKQIESPAIEFLPRWNAIDVIGMDHKVHTAEEERSSTAGMI